MAKVYVKVEGYFERLMKKLLKELTQLTLIISKKVLKITASISWKIICNTAFYMHYIRLKEMFKSREKFYFLSTF